MKICRYGNDQLGVVRGTLVHDVTRAQSEIRASMPYAMLGDAVVAALPQWKDRLDALADKAPGVPLAEVSLLAPVARPSKVIGAPANYADHVEEMAVKRDHAPSKYGAIDRAGLFLKANSSLVGASGGIPIRFSDRENHHELEMVIIVGATASNVPYESALDYIAGYCLGLDMTVRGSEDRSFRKSLDGYSPAGPWMVTADEISDPDNLEISLRVNDEERQHASTRSMIYDCRRLIQFASRFYTLYPGDMIFSGTPKGVGSVVAGDTIHLRGEKLGEMKITVRA